MYHHNCYFAKFKWLYTSATWLASIRIVRLPKLTQQESWSCFQPFNLFTNYRYSTSLHGLLVWLLSIHPIHNTTWRTTVLHPYNFFVYYEACLNHVKTFCNPTCFFNEVLFSCLPGHTNMQISKVLKYNFYVLLMNYMQHEWWLLSSISLPVWQMKWHLVNLTI